MDVLNHLLPSLLQASWQAGVLVLVVVLVQGLLGSRLAPRWHHALWMVVLVRLALPSSVESRWSLFTWIPSVPSQRLAQPDLANLEIEPASVVPSIPPSAGTFPVSTASSPVGAGHDWQGAPLVPVGRVESIPDAPVGPKTSSIAQFSAWDWASLGWLLGAVMLGIFVLVPSIRFHRRISYLPPVSDPDLTELLDACRRRMRVQRRLQIYETDLISSPGLFGLLRPRLLLPSGVRDRFNLRQMEHVFLHEMAHLKRGDLWINWTMTGLLLVHWFNPLVWLAMARIRVDRELACDALALSQIEDEEAKAYGETIIRLVEDFSNRGAVSGLIGMREDPGALRQRIRMIARFRHPGRWSVLGMGLVAAFGLVSLTDAQLPQKTVPEKRADVVAPKDASPTTNSEPVPDLSWAWQVAGRVLDGATLQPIPKFRVTVGGLGFPKFDRESSRLMEDVQGRYSVLVRKGIQRPALRIEAEGYLLGGGAILLGDHAQLEFKLTKGDGPRGRILLPDGKPGAGVRVALIPNVFDLGFTDRSGWNDSHPERYWIKHAEADGTFGFWPSWTLTQVLVSSPAGWALVNAERLKRQPVIRLDPFARMRGTLRRGNQAVANAELNLSLAGSSDILIYGLGQAVTDSLGRFEFDAVPPGTIHIGLKEFNMFGEYPIVPLADIVVLPGQDVVQDLEAPSLRLNPAWTLGLNQALRLNPALNDLEQAPSVRVPGVELAGVVLSPSGAPASRADVAVTLPGRPVCVGRGQLGNHQHELGQTAMTDSAGRFTLPLFEGASSLIAVSEAGIAQATVAAFRASPILRLEPWAEIRGTLKVGARPAPNATLKLMVGFDTTLQRQSLLSTVPEGNPWSRAAKISSVFLEGGDYTFVTDAEGRYRMLYVPPGLVEIRHEMNVLPTTSWHWNLAKVRAQSGKVTQLDLGGGERRIHAKLLFPKARPPLLRQYFCGFLETEELLVLRRRLEALASPEDRLRLADSKEAGEVLERTRVVMLQVALDGTIRSDVVPPGRYGVRIDARQGLLGLGWLTETAPPPFVSEGTFDVPEAKSGEEGLFVDLGTIQLKEINVRTR